MCKLGNRKYMSNNKTFESGSKKWEEINCPVCGGSRFDPLFEKNGEPFVRCHECDLMMINPRPLYDHVIETYDDSYSDFYIKKGNKKIARFNRWAKTVQALGAKTGRWLDIGCSAGFVVKVAQDLGYDAYGVDVESHGIDFARNTLGLKNVSQGMLEDQNYPDEFFDVISIYDVIEHVPDLNKFVTEISRILTKEGVLDIRTPDEGHWAVPKDRSKWNAVIPSEHLYYFNSKTLTMLLQQHGLKMIKHKFNFKPTLKMYFSYSGK